MIETVLVPVDFTIESKELLACVGELKNAGLKKVILLHVVDIYQAQGLAPMFEENAKKRIVEYRQLLDEISMDASTLVIHGDVKKTIVRVADEENVDCIVMGATTSGLVRGRLIGRTTEYISRSSGKIVLIEKYDTLRESEEESYVKACSAKFSKVMLPVDMSENSRTLLDEVSGLVDIIDELVVVHVLEDVKSEEFEITKEQSLNSLSKLGSKFKGDLEVSYYVIEGKPAEVIDSFAEELGITLIAITNRGIGSLKDILLGGTAESLLRKTRKPVLLVPVKNR
ncbi:universal stress protein [Methanolobus sp.]|uniref:universal stress protein n=1 Tax=Methanolobus sp. TaxID=1874737 RepID=UPI0025DAE81D|nr:universal stress protein [Methanolobus sp.]